MQGVPPRLTVADAPPLLQYLLYHRTRLLELNSIEYVPSLLREPGEAVPELCKSVREPLFGLPIPKQALLVYLRCLAPVKVHCTIYVVHISHLHYKLRSEIRHQFRSTIYAGYLLYFYRQAESLVYTYFKCSSYYLLRGNQP